MNKKILILKLALLMPVLVFSMNLPDTLLVNNNQQLLLKFPTSIQYVDLGSNDIIGKTWSQKMFLSLKSRDPEIESTTISVVTSDGKYYSYVLKYSSNLQVLAYSINDGVIKHKEAEVSISKTTHFTSSNWSIFCFAISSLVFITVLSIVDNFAPLAACKSKLFISN
jgi:hypothetical protein